MNAPLLQIGTNQAAVREARGAINDILRQPHVDNKTKIEALRALSTLCNVNGTTVSGCTFTGKP